MTIVIILFVSASESIKINISLNTHINALDCSFLDKSYLNIVQLTQFIILCSSSLRCTHNVCRERVFKWLYSLNIFK